jgi:predicted CoA-binding protein
VAEAELDEFFAGRRLALVGASVVPYDLSRIVLRTLDRRGYDVVPIRPGVRFLDEWRAYPTVCDVPGRLDGAVIMTVPRFMERAIFDCAERGIERFWLDPGGVRGVPADALDLCTRRGLIFAIGGSVPVETIAQRLRRESRRLVRAFAVPAREGALH